MWPTERIRGGHTSVRAMPRSYQVTPVDPRAATGDTAKASQTQSRSTGEKRVSPPPPGSQTDKPDDTDRRGRRLSLRRRAGRSALWRRDLPWRGCGTQLRQRRRFPVRSLPELWGDANRGREAAGTVKEQQPREAAAEIGRGTGRVSSPTMRVSGG